MSPSSDACGTGPPEYQLETGKDGSAKSPELGGRSVAETPDSKDSKTGLDAAHAAARAVRDTLGEFCDKQLAAQELSLIHI